MKCFSLILFLFYSLVAFSHGEDKPGPNGGYIQMPGSFHTEVVPGEGESFKIYLLNLQNQEPTVKDSAVKVFFVKGKAKESVSCMPMDSHFHCAGDLLKKSGTLIVMANRMGAVGIEAKYKLPLKMNNRGRAKPSGHEGHH